MQKLLLCLTVICLSFGAKAQWIIEDKEAEVRTLDQHFTKIKIDGNVIVYLVQSEENQMAVSGEKKQNLTFVTSKITNGVLEVNAGAYNNKQSKVYIGFKELESLELNGNITLQLTSPWLSETVSMKVSGLVNFKGKVQMINLNVDIDGLSKVILDGDVKNLNLKCSGNSKFTGPDLMVDDCSMIVGGVSKVEISSIKRLKANVSGLGKVVYHNLPDKLETNVLDMGEIKRANQLP